ncbi:Chromatin target of PRMT1 protein C-terminal [Arabidopsis suecica]|uniref:Chromatin target of PRMT1 protein C-terminal n=1 Tax=Arabidopsis suecica TaxID=45249 RepID=A0A8T1YQ47_ARASU|nr:Chromatin target of PRMT1 protein C-terminal [Arabidopsis suecica]KAG7548316.1 Chromatin target of PRMT1 protein C-terminal [Arabidopsis suecica]
MSGALNMTLDEIVKRGKTARSVGRGNSRPGRGRGRGRGGGGSNGFLGGGRGAGPARRGPLAVNARPSSLSINKPVRRVRSLPWQSGLFEDGLRAAGVSGVEVGTRLHVTNLDQGVTNEDIRELFSEIGEVERYAIHYDKNGRPSGTAEVVYPRRSDAFQALKKYNNVLLDGRPMRLEILGGNNSEAPLSGRVNVNVTGLNGRLKRTVVIQQGGGRGRVRGGRGGRGPAPTISRRLPIHNQQGGMRGGRGGFRGRGRGGGGRGRGGGRGNGKKPVEKSAADLDKDLESYHADAMNTS